MKEHNLCIVSVFLPRLRAASLRRAASVRTDVSLKALIRRHWTARIADALR